MTHDELLEEINFLPLDGLHAWFQPALRAVVELHKPVKKLHMPLFCAECDGYADYPCATIREIAKELS